MDVREAARGAPALPACGPLVGLWTAPLLRLPSGAMKPRQPPAWIAVGLEALLAALLPARGPRWEGRRHGVWMQVLPGGRPLSETTWERGVRHGRATRWYLSGRKRWVGEWRQGEKTGEWFYFHRDGKIDGPRTGKYEKGLRFAALKGFNDWNA